MNKTKKFILTALALCISFAVNAQKSFSVNDITGTNGETVEMRINMNNGDLQVVSMQFDLELPKGVVPGKPKAADRSDDCAVKAGMTPDGKYRIIAFSMSNTPFDGSEGTVLTIPLTLGEKTGISKIQISNIIVTEACTFNRHTDWTAAPATIRTRLLGDLNDNGRVSVCDYNKLFRMVINKEQYNPQLQRHTAADINHDHQLNMSDIEGIVEILLRVIV